MDDPTQPPTNTGAAHEPFHALPLTGVSVVCSSHIFFTPALANPSSIPMIAIQAPYLSGLLCKPARRAGVVCCLWQKRASRHRGPARGPTIFAAHFHRTPRPVPWPHSQQSSFDWPLLFISSHPHETQSLPVLTPSSHLSGPENRPPGLHG